MTAGISFKGAERRRQERHGAVKWDAGNYL